MKQRLKKISEFLSDKIVNTSTSYFEVKNIVFDTLKQVNQLAYSIIELAKTVQTHHEAIHELYDLHDKIEGKQKDASKIILTTKEKSPNKPN